MAEPRLDFLNLPPRQRDLVGIFIPKSEDQIVWEGEVRLRAEALLFANGSNRSLPGQFQERTQFLPVGRFESLSGWGRNLAAQRQREAVWFQGVGQYLYSSPLRSISIPFDASGELTISSRNPVIESSVEQALQDEEIGKSFPQFTMLSCDLNFWSSYWGLGARKRRNLRTISVAGNEYEVTSSGLTLPTLARDQIETVVEIVERHYREGTDS